MYNFFVATVGKRDVQINRDRLEENNLTLMNEGKSWYIKDNDTQQLIEIDFPGNSMSSPNQSHYVIRQPRIGGDIIRFNQSFLKACDFPIITPVIEKIFLEEKNLKEVKLVYTDQDNINYRNGDTLYFSSIITKYLELTYNLDVDEFGVWNSPADIDIQYADFKHKRSQANTNLLPPNEEVSLIYLLVQGGMDQINFALTLRLMENYRGKLIYLQKPEKDEVIQRQFPIQFIKNLTRNQAIELINNFEFKGAHKILESDTLKSLCELSVQNIELNYDRAFELSQDTRLSHISFVQQYYNDVCKLTQTQYRQLIISISLLHDFYKGEPNNLLWKLRTFGEMLLLPEVEEFLGLSNIQYDEYDFTEAVEGKMEEGRYLLDFLLSGKNSDRIKTELKWRKLKDDYVLLEKIYNFKYLNKPSVKKKETENIRIAIKELKDPRNHLLHKGYYITIGELESALNTKKHTIDSLLKQLEAYMQSIGVSRDTLHLISIIQTYCIEMLNEDAW